MSVDFGLRVKTSGQTYIRILPHNVLDKLTQLVIARAGINPCSLDPVALRRELVQTFPALTSDDDTGHAVKVMDREGKGTTYVGGGPDDEDTFRVFDACHGICARVGDQIENPARRKPRHARMQLYAAQHSPWIQGRRACCKGSQDIVALDHGATAKGELRQIAMTYRSIWVYIYVADSRSYLRPLTQLYILPIHHALTHRLRPPPTKHPFNGAAHSRLCLRRQPGICTTSTSSGQYTRPTFVMDAAVWGVLVMIGPFWAQSLDL